MRATRSTGAHFAPPALLGRPTCTVCIERFLLRSQPKRAGLDLRAAGAAVGVLPSAGAAFSLFAVGGDSRRDLRGEGAGSGRGSEGMEMDVMAASANGGVPGNGAVQAFQDGFRTMGRGMVSSSKKGRSGGC